MTAHDVRNTSVGRPSGVPEQRLEHLVADADAVALDDAPRVRLPGPHLYGRISYTSFNGVCAARRNRVNPASVATCRMAASPAWAPRL